MPCKTTNTLNSHLYNSSIGYFILLCMFRMLISKHVVLCWTFFYFVGSFLIILLYWLCTTKCWNNRNRFTDIDKTEIDAKFNQSKTFFLNKSFIPKSTHTLKCTYVVSIIAYSFIFCLHTFEDTLSLNGIFHLYISNS